MKLQFVVLLAGWLGTSVWSEASDTWPGFRGVGNSHSEAHDLPRAWEARSPRPGNWTLRLPGYGQSSPIVWKDRVFATAVSGEKKQNLHVVAVSLADGEVLWQRDFSGTQKVKDSDTVSRGAPTPVADEARLYAVFESGDVFALTHEGELLWHHSFVAEFGEIKGPHGFASSPVLVDDLCIIQVAHAGPSYILALENKTGGIRWRSDHPSQTGWSTPAVLRNGNTTQLIISTSGSVRALDAKTGAEVWSFADVNGNNTPSPTVAGNYIVTGASAERGGGPRASDSQGIGDQPKGNGRNDGQAPAAGRGSGQATASPPTGSIALEIDGKNLKSTPRVAWRSSKISAGYASPLIVDGLSYFVNRVGVLQCVDLARGDVLWQHRLPSEVWASPVANEGHITLFCKHGQVLNLKAGRELGEVLESQISTTDIVYGVAAVDGAWIVRFGRGLTRISGMGSRN